ncbi:hypothetical protein KOW79_018200 [Hemibagrus wyckioides]|nr:hypothetical protein KOW79_018199 [Hemibagrus wyckioides]KAG7318445.1 hypothetical protein KOW79_018200 [Hemibagrus wyckioides]
MNFGKFLPSASSFRSVACVGGLLALTSAGYWAYRRLKRRSGLPAADHQPAPDEMNEGQGDVQKPDMKRSYC